MCAETVRPPPSTPTTCSKCGTIKKSGQRSCCVRGGDWFKKCGNPGDLRFEHTWFEGIEACPNRQNIAAQVEVAEIPTTVNVFAQAVVSGTVALEATMLAWALTLGYVLVLH